jgi:hypothetical protein
MQDFKKLIDAELAARGWTAYRLIQAIPKGGPSPQTIYNLMNGKPVQASTMAAVLDVLGFEIKKKGAK